MVAALREYVWHVAPGAPFGCMDETGRLELHGPELEGVASSTQETRRRHPLNRQSARAPDLFTDLNQWLLKVLLAKRISPTLLHAPREPIRNASHLAELAHVSVPSAARLVAALNSEGYLAEVRGLDLVQLRELLMRWRNAAQRPARELQMRWVLPPQNDQGNLSKLLRAHSERLEQRRETREREGFLVESVDWERGTRACLGMFAACDALGLGIVRGVPRHLYVEHMEPRMLQRFGLTAAKPPERVDVVVRQPRFPESVFRAAVNVDDVPVADVVQCWIDLVDHPARGTEQAAHIWDKALGRAT